MSDYDVLVIGGGPNGLMTAGLLQAQGKNVCCTELNDHVGGLASNAHEFPGYVHNRGMWFLMFAQIDELLSTLQLDEYGLELMDPKHVGVILPTNPPDPPFRMYNDPQETMNDLGENFGKESVQHFADFMKYLEPFSTGMSYALANEPISIGQIIDSMPSHEAQTAMSTLMYGTTSELAYRFFPNKNEDPIRGYLAGMCTDGFAGGPGTPGSALTLAYHFGTPSKGEGATGSQFKVCKGHMGEFSNSLARSFEGHGGTLMTSTEVSKILIRDNTAYGVRLADGSEITADVVISDLDDYQTFIRLVGEDDTPSWLVDAIKHINYTDVITQTYLAFNRLPTFRDEYEYLNHDDWRFQIWTMGSCEQFEQAWYDTEFGRVPKVLGTGLYFPSILDPTLAPPGHQTGTFCVSPSWPKGVRPEDRDATKEEIFDNICAYYERFMPDFRDCIDDWKMMAPPDYEAKYRNTGGTWTHGMIQLNQMFDHRPVKGMSNFRAPIKRLYLCGSSNHPGPGVNGRPPQICINAMKTDGVLDADTAIGGKKRKRFAGSR